MKIKSDESALQRKLVRKTYKTEIKKQIREYRDEFIKMWVLVKLMVLKSTAEC